MILLATISLLLAAIICAGSVLSRPPQPPIWFIP